MTYSLLKQLRYCYPVSLPLFLLQANELVYSKISEPQSMRRTGHRHKNENDRRGG